MGRSIIKDLLDKLAAQAKAEKFEGLEASITEKTAEKKELKMDIAELANEIAKLMKALSEATELRVDEKEDNDQTVKEAEAGKDAVEFALKTLKEFYSNAFVQTNKYVPPDSDREGNTVGDLSPEIFDSKYHGEQSSSKGILGLLEVILSDFDRTDTTVTDQEKTAAEKFEDYKKALMRRKMTQ